MAGADRFQTFPTVSYVHFCLGDDIACLRRQGKDSSWSSEARVRTGQLHTYRTDSPSTSQSCTVQGKKRNITTTQHSQRSVAYQGTAFSCLRGGKVKRIAHPLVLNSTRLVLLDVGASREKVLQPCLVHGGTLPRLKASLLRLSLPPKSTASTSPRFYATRRRQGMNRALHEASFRVLDH